MLILYTSLYLFIIIKGHMHFPTVINLYFLPDWWWTKVWDQPPPSQTHTRASEEMACAFLPVEEKLNLPGPISAQHQQNPHNINKTRMPWGFVTVWDFLPNSEKDSTSDKTLFHGGSKDEHKTSLCFMVTNNTIRISRPQWETSTGNAYYKYIPWELKCWFGIC